MLQVLHSLDVDQLNTEAATGWSDAAGHGWSDGAALRRLLGGLGGRKVDPGARH